MRWLSRKRAIVFAGIALGIAVLALAVAWPGTGQDADTETTSNAAEVTGSDAAPAPRQSLGSALIQHAPETPIAAASSNGAQVPSEPSDGTLPAEGARWGQMYSALMPEARAGNKLASDRLYDATLDCVQFKLVLASARDRLRTKPNASSMSVEQIVRELDSYQTIQSVLRNNAASCSRVARDDKLFKHVYSVLGVAARNGNENAAVCYAFGAYGERARDAMGADGTFASMWKRKTKAFMESGMKRGDWRMVILMRMYFDPASRKFASSYDPRWEARQFQPDPVMAYRYAALRAVGARLGGGEAAQRRTSSMLAGYRRRYDIPQAQVRDADQWAQRMYDQHFAGHAWLGANEANWCIHGE